MRIARALVALVAVAAACSSPAAPGPSLGASAWQVAPAGFGPEVFITSTAPATGDQPWVAVGWSTGADGQPETGCFSSPDARRWTPCPLLPDDLDGSHTRLLAVRRIGPALVAAGVAVGALHGNLRPTLWRAAPGEPLSELNLPRELFGGERIITFTGLGTGPLGGFAAGTWDGVIHHAVAQVWRTGDGADWQRLDGVDALTSPAGELFRGRAVADGPRRVVLVGAAIGLARPADRDDGAAWWSDDGRQWRRADVAGAGMGGPGDQELLDVMPVGDGFVAAGSDRATASVWWSADGTRWRRAGRLPGGDGREARVESLASAGGRQWASGVVAGAPHLWSSADGRRWVRAPLPSAWPAGVPARAVALAGGNGLLLLTVQVPDGTTSAVIGLP